jgi:folate-binding protein YgfZ
MVVTEPSDDLTDDLDSGYRALTESVGAVAIHRDAVVVRGPDALTFLQGQLSQDIDSIGVGTSMWSLLLQPQGKVEAWVRISGLADGDSVLVDVDGGYGDATIARLRRFLLRVKVELAPWPDGRAGVVALRGPGSSVVATAAATGAALLADAGWPNMAGVDAFGGVVPDRVPRVGHDAFEAVRIEQGVPAMGAELVAGQTIPAEAGAWLIDSSVSFTKGCYTGQELVARIDSRGGNVARRLRGLIIGAERDALPAVGSEVAVAGATVGALTSVAWSPGFGCVVALAYIGRKVDAPADAIVRGAGGNIPARIEDLPLSR